MPYKEVMASIEENTSPYLYVATFFFALSACSSDLLFIRFSLSFGFVFLVLASLSGYATDGSFHYSPLLDDGIVDVTMCVNAVLFLLNLFICARLIGDEFAGKKLSEQEMALFYFFRARCGMNTLQFQHILKNGCFLDLPADTVVPDTDSVLYLILEGKVSCQVKFSGDRLDKVFLRRSGQFFDIKLFNLFSLPVGFDDKEFHAKTCQRTVFFCWKIHGLIAMRDLESPSLRQYWEYMVLRALTGIAVQHHLNETATLYDSLLVPEGKGWLDGAPSRDFRRQQTPGGNWELLKGQLRILQDSFLQIIPPHGVRHRPRILESNPKQAYMELVCKTAAMDEGEAPRFLNHDADPAQDGTNHRFLSQEGSSGEINQKDIP